MAKTNKAVSMATDPLWRRCSGEGAPAWIRINSKPWLRYVENAVAETEDAWAAPRGGHEVVQFDASIPKDGRPPTEAASGNQRTRRKSQEAGQLESVWSHMIVIVLVGGVALVAIVIGIVWDSSRFLSRYVEAVWNRFPRTREFAFGAILGFYTGVVPAIVAYALVHRPWAAGVVDGGFMLAGGFGWAQVCRRSRQKERLAGKERKESAGGPVTGIETRHHL